METTEIPSKYMGNMKHKPLNQGEIMLLVEHSERLHSFPFSQ